jgi:hypothetical protein
LPLKINRKKDFSDKRKKGRKPRPNPLDQSNVVASGPFALGPARRESTRIVPSRSGSSAIVGRSSDGSGRKTRMDLGVADSDKEDSPKSAEAEMEEEDQGFDEWDRHAPSLIVPSASSAFAGLKLESMDSDDLSMLSRYMTKVKGSFFNLSLL